MNIKDELIAVTRALNSARLDYALCGGLAVALHGYPRLTKDIDILIDGKDLEAVKQVLRSIGFDLETGIIRFRVGQPDEEQLFRLTKVQESDFLTLDIVLLSESLREKWGNRVCLAVGGEQMWVLSKEGLIQMKHRAGRPQDLLDISLLESGGDAE